MRQRGKLRYVPLRYKLLLSYLFLVLVPVIGIGSYSYVSSVRSISEHTRNNMEFAVKQIASGIDGRLANIVRGSEEIFSDQTLSRYLSGYYLSFEKYAITTQYILPRLESAANLPDPNVQLSLYLDNGHISEFYYHAPEANSGSGRQYSIYHTERIRGEDWYRSLDLNYATAVWRQVGEDAAAGQISYLRPLINYDTLQPIGLIRMTVQLKDIFHTPDMSRLGEGSRLFVVGGQGDRLWYSSAVEGQSDWTVWTEESGEGSAHDLQIEEAVTGMPAKVVARIPYASFQEGSRQVRTATILICLASLLVLTVISVILSNYVLRRFHKIIGSLHAFKEGDFAKRMPIQGHDEFSQIGEAFNEMASTIEKLIEEVYVGRLEKKEAELNVLHSQMNPHFLYNTFSSISRMAKLGEIEKLHQVIRHLAKFYRLTLNKGETIISIEKELQILQSYVEIQTIKHADRIIVHYDIDPGLLGYDTVKFILQPFVENALEHAWYDDQIRMEIRLYAEGDTVWMEVRDNGLGMKEEVMHAILDDSGQGIGYGIRNVDQRIKLQFGRGYGVSLSSELGEGTTVRLSMPKYVQKAAGPNSALE
ncbi:cache domain-containing sensor histidine kinase [Paenibacillus mucilaginosus]|uniref:histidine kinase n=3 Tax=Paenibacillus mucilaginosus TaxID=61624 RepID=H6NNH2_9BACL|nr:sensor histidine kinase [Paenibacillus mucilaginosus]AEI44790.1 histidine kinase [Paenibacillus mucilaginosus KNP414]AFC32551.1 histidine kinase [Paenibacillus mucilaginosus 3016]AFH64871.1 histidine kinase [Paenibacillus mucilaginosus K02]MCG7214839.1 histidine kinase [Paenibacillus mucilaginosus]WDM26321.1 sensor histidine kinase [Paenibacillus mucilaginosus]